jgi:hypothetical protein
MSSQSIIATHSQRERLVVYIFFTESTNKNRDGFLYLNKAIKNTINRLKDAPLYSTNVVNSSLLLRLRNNFIFVNVNKNTI